MAESTFLAELRNVTFSYGDRVILRDVTLAVPRGKVTALMGASGGARRRCCACLGAAQGPEWPGVG